MQLNEVQRAEIARLHEQNTIGQAIVAWGRAMRAFTERCDNVRLDRAIVAWVRAMHGMVMRAEQADRAAWGAAYALASRRFVASPTPAQEIPLDTSKATVTVAPAPKGRKHRTFGQKAPSAQTRATREKGCAAQYSSLKGWKGGIGRHAHRNSTRDRVIGGLRQETPDKRPQSWADETARAERAMRRAVNG